jgi:hypothetical protein
MGARQLLEVFNDRIFEIHGLPQFKNAMGKIPTDTYSFIMRAICVRFISSGNAMYPRGTGVYRTTSSAESLSRLL